jgi:hypothetical protein
LVAKTVLLAAVRALPGNAVAGHAPHVFIHARLTDSETAPAGPAERGDFPTAVTGFIPGSQPFSAVPAFPGNVRHYILNPISIPCLYWQQVWSGGALVPNQLEYNTTTVCALAMFLMLND